MTHLLSPLCTAAPALHKMSDRDATTTMSNLVDAGDDDVQIVNSMSHQSEHSTLEITITQLNFWIIIKFNLVT